MHLSNKLKTAITYWTCTEILHAEQKRLQKYFNHSSPSSRRFFRHTSPEETSYIEKMDKVIEQIAQDRRIQEDNRKILLGFAITVMSITIATTMIRKISIEKTTAPIER